jgi:nitroreductase
MKLNLSADELLTTTRAVRKRLDFDRPVEREIIEDCLRIALQAPTASNTQLWQWVLITEAPTREAIAAVYAENFETYRRYIAQQVPYPDGDVRGAQRERVSASAAYLAENFHRAPVMLIPCITNKLDRAPTAFAASQWGSLLPGVWSFMLAARERGLGSAWTTIHLLNDGEQRVADILGIPFDSVTQAGLFPVAYTKGTDFQPAKRVPLEGVVHWNRWSARPAVIT